MTEQNKPASEEPRPSEPQEFQNKPVRVVAIRFAEDGSNWIKCHQFMGVQCPVNVPTFYVAISTLEGEMLAKRGDWIIRGIKGEFYPCKPDIFEATYDRLAAPVRSGEPLSLKEQQFTKLVEMHIDQLVDEGCSCDVMNGYSCSIHKIASDLKAALASRAQPNKLAQHMLDLLVKEGVLVENAAVTEVEIFAATAHLIDHLRASRASSEPSEGGEGC